MGSEMSIRDRSINFRLSGLQSGPAKGIRLPARLYRTGLPMWTVAGNIISERMLYRCPTASTSRCWNFVVVLPSSVCASGGGYTLLAYWLLARRNASFPHSLPPCSTCSRLSMGVVNDQSSFANEVCPCTSNLD